MAVLPNRERLIQLLNKQLGQIPGVQSTETSIVLEIHKQIYHWSPFDQALKPGVKPMPRVEIDEIDRKIIQMLKRWKSTVSDHRQPVGPGRRHDPPQSGPPA